MLKQLFDKYSCDKSSKHGYDAVYEPHFELLKDQPINMLEVGVFKGESFNAWVDYFPNATIFGIDIFTRTNPAELPILSHPRVKWLKGDSTNASISTIIQKQWGDVKFDIIIDDGLHTPRGNAATFNNLIDFLAPTGMFFIEDVWPLDIMTAAEMSHSWIKQNPEKYNALEMSKFLRAIEKYNIERYDLRKQSKEGDSYIIKITK